MLAPEQRTTLATTGLAHLPGVVDRDTAAGIADDVWAHLARRGIERESRATWPSGLISKLQPLRTRGAFDAFDTAATSTVVDELLGAGQWAAFGSWGPALVTFPEAGPWDVPSRSWHFDLPAKGDPDQPGVARLFGYATDVGPGGGATMAVAGSHEVVRRMVAAAPDHDVGRSADVRARLTQRHPWFRALCAEGGNRVQQFMVDGEEIDGVHVRAVELTADAGDVVVMLPWTMHSLSRNCATSPRFMVTHWLLRRPNVIETNISSYDM